MSGEKVPRDFLGLTLNKMELGQRKKELKMDGAKNGWINISALRMIIFQLLTPNSCYKIQDVDGSD